VKRKNLFISARNWLDYRAVNGWQPGVNGWQFRILEKGDIRRPGRDGGAEDFIC
jgi:hypothetical protein